MTKIIFRLQGPATSQSQVNPPTTSPFGQPGTQFPTSSINNPPRVPPLPSESPGAVIAGKYYYIDSQGY